MEEKSTFYVTTSLQGESLIFQHRYATLIGQSKREDVMKGHLKTLKMFRGRSLAKYLSECKCGPSRSRNDQCTDLAQYETSNYVSFRGNQISDLGDESFPALSSFYKQYLDDLVDQIDLYFPGEGQKSKAKLKMNSFDPFDHEKWPSSRYHINDYIPKSIKDAAKMFGINYNNVLQEDFNQLVTGILKNSIDNVSPSMIANQKIAIESENFWCKHKKDDHLGLAHVQLS